MEQDQLEQLSPPVRVDTSIFRNGYEARDTDVFIAVMGMTGVGKSTLISQLTTSGPKPTIGNSLSSCTQNVDVFRHEYSCTRTVYLIDTPGFDDSSLSDLDVLHDLATWFAPMYDSGIRLHGIFYLHRISDDRFGGSARRNLSMFTKLCGSNELRNVILVTTRWDQVSSESGTQREAELKQTPDFWGCMVTLGSRVERYNDDISSARKLVEMVLPPDQQHERRTGMTLELQRELVDDDIHLQDTQVGLEVSQHPHRQLFQTTQKDNEALRKALRTGKDELQKKLEAGLRELVANLNAPNPKEPGAMEGPMVDKYSPTPDPIFPTPSSQRVDSRGPTKSNNGSRTSDDSRISLEEVPSGHDDRGGISNQVSLNRFMRTSASQQTPVGSHWPKRTRRDIGLSLRGCHCSFNGPVHSQSYLPQSTVDTLIRLERTPNMRVKRIVLGEGLSYYAHYHDGTFWAKCYYNGSVKAHYPSLFHFLGEAGNTGCPQAISLGPAGSYFIRVDNRRSFLCHPHAPIDDRAESAARLWWGVDGAYVLEREASAEDEPLYDHELRGGYSDLAEILDTSTAL